VTEIADHGRRAAAGAGATAVARRGAARRGAARREEKVVAAAPETSPEFVWSRNSRSGSGS